MKMVYTHENKFLVDNVRNILSLNRIETVLKNEFLSSGAGELSPIDVWPELWVSEDDFDKAQAIVAEIQSPAGEHAWFCRRCHERNEPTFEICWQCQADQDYEPDR